MSGTSLWVVAGAVVLGLILFAPVVKWLGKFMMHTLGGLVALFLFGPIGNFIGVTLGVNLFNGVVLGLLGVPGFGLLLLLHWMTA